MKNVVTIIMGLTLLLFLISCGEQMQMTSNHIVAANIKGGDYTGKRWKTTVALVDYTGEMICSGFVIDRFTIGTTGRCLYGEGQGARNYIDSPDRLRIFYGTYLSSTYIDGEYLLASSVVAHPQYLQSPDMEGKELDSSFANTDVGYITLQEPLNIAEEEIIPIMTDGEAAELFQVSRNVTIVGFGDDNFGSNGSKKETTVIIKSVLDGHITAGDSQHMGIEGDLGSALYARNDDGELRIIGVFSLFDSDVNYFGKANILHNWIKRDKKLQKVKQLVESDSIYYAQALKKVEDDLFEMVKLDPSNIEALTLLVAAHIKVGNTDEAIRVFNRKLIPTLKRFPVNEMVLREIFKLNIEHEEIYMKRAELRFSKLAYDSSLIDSIIDDLDMALSISSDFINAHKLLAIAKSSIGDTSAISNFRIAKEYSAYSEYDNENLILSNALSGGSLRIVKYLANQGIDFSKNGPNRNLKFRVLKDGTSLEVLKYLERVRHKFSKSEVESIIFTLTERHNFDLALEFIRSKKKGILVADILTELQSIVAKIWNSAQEHGDIETLRKVKDFVESVEKYKKRQDGKWFSFLS